MTPHTRFVLCAFALALAGPPSAEAQNVTVEQLVSIAIARAPELRAARLDITVAGGQVIQAGLRPNPILTASQELGEHGVLDDRRRVAARSVPASGAD